MRYEVEVKIPAEGVPGFTLQMVNWRRQERDQLNAATAPKIRAEHEARVQAADRLLAIVDDQRDGEPLSLVAADPVEGVALAMAVDGALRTAAERAGDVGIVDYEGFDRAAESIRVWTKIARDLNARCDVLEGGWI